jgi:protein-S-isoprenylcysteine O-methyltransferase Ste14
MVAVFSSLIIGVYAALPAIAFHVQIVLIEEPWLESHFGNEWLPYCAEINR